MSLVRRARERPRVAILAVLLGAAALVGAGLIGAALAGEGDDETVELERALAAEHARALELQTQLEATVRRIEDIQDEARADRRRRARQAARAEARSRSRSGSGDGRPSQENQP